jgi:hypothetical protein
MPITYRLVKGSALTHAELDANFTDLDTTKADATVFSSVADGLAPLSGGGTATYLRADGTWATPAGAGDMVLASTQTVTGAKTFSNTMLKLAGATSGASTLVAPAVAGTTTFTLPTATTTLVGTDTTQSLTNKTLAGVTVTGTSIIPTQAAGDNTTQMASTAHVFAERTNAATLTNKTLTSPAVNTPTLGGAVAGTFTLPATATMAATPSQADSSAKIATTAYVDTGLSTKAAANATVAITGANTLVSATHFNRHITWTGGTTAAQALSGTASTGDFIECANNGTATLTFTNCTEGAGYRLSVEPGESFYAIYTGGAWKSITPINVGQSALNSQSAAYTLVLTDAGKTIYHPSADTTARIWTIPANSAVAFPIGTIVTFDNDDAAGALTISITTDTLVLVGTAGTTGSRTLAEGGRAVAMKVSATRWRIDGNGLS